VYEPERRNTDEPPEPRWYPSVVALPDGRMLIVGGIRYDGNRIAKDYEAAYQTLPDRYQGRTLYHELFDPCTGQYERGLFRVPDQSDGQRHDTDLNRTYPRLHLVSLWDGRTVQARVVSTGPSITSYALKEDWVSVVWQRLLTARNVGRSDGTSVLLPNFRADNPHTMAEQALYEVMVIGGGYVRQDDYISNAHDSTEILTFSPLTEAPYTHMEVRNGPRLAFRRAHLNAVLLPTGQILVIGGISGTFDPDGAGEQVRRWLYPDQLVLATELLTYTPAGWQVEEVAAAPAELNDEVDDQRPPDVPKVPNGARVYHSTALLLPDGRVLAAGSATNAYYRSDYYDDGRRDYLPMDFDNYVPTLYSPPYLFKPDGSPRGANDRPRILLINPAPTELDYQQVFKVTYALSNEGAAIRSVVLVRPGAVTHSVNFEQRLVRLHFVVASSNGLHITAPWDPAIAPPGWYMLFLVDGNGVPSEAAWVRLKGCGLQATQLTVTLEGVQGISAEQAEAIEHSPMTLEFRNAATGATRASYTLPMMRPDEQGRVVLRLWSDLPAGVYELYVYPYRSWLGRRVRLSWQPGGSYSLVLRNGDVVKDNVVDYGDLLSVLAQQGLEGLSEADVNCDGVVDAEDAALVATNTGTQGDE